MHKVNKSDLATDPIYDYPEIPKPSKLTQLFRTIISYPSSETRKKRRVIRLLKKQCDIRYKERAFGRMGANTYNGLHTEIDRTLATLSRESLMQVFSAFPERSIRDLVFQFPSDTIYQILLEIPRHHFCPKKTALFLKNVHSYIKRVSCRIPEEDLEQLKSSYHHCLSTLSSKNLALLKKDLSPQNIAARVPLLLHQHLEQLEQELFQSIDQAQTIEHILKAVSKFQLEEMEEHYRNYRPNNSLEWITRFQQHPLYMGVLIYHNLDVLKEFLEVVVEDQTQPNNQPTLGRKELEALAVMMVIKGNEQERLLRTQAALHTLQLLRKARVPMKRVKSFTTSERIFWICNFNRRYYVQNLQSRIKYLHNNLSLLNTENKELIQIYKYRYKKLEEDIAFCEELIEIRDSNFLQKESFWKQLMHHRSDPSTESIEKELKNSIDNTSAQYELYYSRLWHLYQEQELAPWVIRGLLHIPRLVTQRYFSKESFILFKEIPILIQRHEQDKELKTPFY